MKHEQEIRRMGRRDFLCQAAGASCVAGLFPAKTLLGATTPGGESVTPAPLYWAWWGWEPLAHYKRAGGTVGAVNTKSPTLEQWYDRLHSESLARQMADLGINLGVTHFFKGFGLVAERAEQQRTATLVKFAHRHGIKVLGYCQSRSLYHEQFLAEEPRADEKGQLRTWSSVKYRWAPCILAREFRDYMKRAIRVGLEEVGLDGLHFDNDYAQPCYCPRCQDGFRAWLTQHFPAPQQRFGRASFADVRLPSTQPAPGRIDDPLVQAWVRFRCESLAGYHAELCDYARQIRPNVILLANPAYPRGPNSPYLRSVWPVHVGRHLNLMFAENGNFSGLEGAALVSQVRANKQAAAIGYRVISTVWRRNKLNASGLPETAGEVSLQIAEAAANGGIPGTNWALRPGGDGDRMRIDRPDLSAALAQSLRFVRGNEKLLAGARPVRDVAVLRTFASLGFNAPEADPQVEAAEEVLIRSGFAWETVFGDDLRRLDGFAALVLAGQSHLSDAEVGAIRAFARGGGAVILVGDNGRYDENGSERAQPAFAGLEDRRVARVEVAPLRPQAGTADRTTVPPSEAHGTSVLLPKWSRQLAEAIERTAGTRLSVRLRGTDTVTLSACELPGHRLAVHLVNYAANATPTGLHLDLGGRWQTGRTAQLLVPDATERTLAIQRGAQPGVAVPPFAVYSVLVFGGA
jgi:hypothetical protein